ncbi:hypothetical protein BKA62DRAFT_799226 [Auriculariales sp. MPI-PUGE-AT-0066]|nr:hypothetical protein BKA62DRAFT_799226 [Auriculariales sp. MPI-PUGE-AT-0066]
MVHLRSRRLYIRVATARTPTIRVLLATAVEPTPHRMAHQSTTSPRRIHNLLETVQVISLSSHSDRRDTLASSILHRPSLSPSQSKAYLEIEGMLGLGPGRLALADRGTATRASASALSHFPALQDSKSSTITANQDPAPWVVRAKRDSPPVSVPQTPRMSVATTSTESSFAQSLFYIPKKQQNRLSTASTMAHHNFTEFAEDALEPLDQAKAGDSLGFEGSPDTPTSIPMHVGSERLRAARSETELRPRRCRHNRLQRTSTSTSSTQTSPNAGDISLSLLSQRISQVTTTTDLMASGLDDPFSADPAEIPPVPPLPPHLVSPKTSEFAIVAHPEVASAPATPLSPTGTASSTAGSSTFTQITHTHTHRVVLPAGVSSVTVQIAPGTTVEVNFEQGSGSTKPKQQPFLKKWKSKIFNKKDGDIV